MTSRPTQTMCLVVAAVALGASLPARAVKIQQAGPTPQERVAALKQSMQESQTKLRQYEWIETTIICLKGISAWVGADSELVQEKAARFGQVSRRARPRAGD